MPVRQDSGLGPAIPRRRLGNALRELRDGRGKTLADVAGELLISTSKLSRLEKGQGPAQERDVRDLLDYYGQADTELGERMRRWAGEGREAPWWQQQEPLPSVTNQYMQYETAAAEISGYVAHFVPSLLQTPDYARAMYTALNADDPDGIESLVGLTMRRQEVITRASYPVGLDVVVDESVLHRLVGSPAVMHAQLVALADATERPNVVVRIFPFAAGPHAAIAEGVFSLFHFRRTIDHDVVNIEGRVVDAYVEQPADVQIYRRLLSGLRDSALSAADSTVFIRRVAQGY
ncbi:MAG: helix-turn-helix domain-containing protein [Pseudonocardia sp.]